ncbi:MAG TPA: family 1 glycosylhydrolase [Planctomycetota bacterium]|nr:family 1 glycosylhydrolase [Planctomycetota bacterium]
MTIETWAGVECTVNRVGDTYSDQCERIGHDQRDDDLHRLAALGIDALRYPVVWERVLAKGWSWSDRRLATLRELGVRPIVGLLHHGSGPPDTSLIDPKLPESFAEYAGRCAERYPWVRDWTPVNEPLTTARFSGLYGIWYPHGRDDATFIRALLVQCKATILAMRRIRAAIPDARLVQTEDLGHTASTPPLAYQAELENRRRWLSLDLLCGRVTDGHPLRRYLRRAGASDEELAWFAANPCPPDIIGINHYVTSERWIDHRLELYPAATHGGNGRDRYADVEAVRAAPLVGREALLRETWQRYRLPIAITEAHLYATREEQLRWLDDAFRTADRLEADGVDIRAVTAWAAFGLVDWDSLVTCRRDHYEPGLFDVRGRQPRPTSLARLVAARARGHRDDHPLLAVPGWWRREGRTYYDAAPVRHDPVPRDVPALLITGGGGHVGQAIARSCAARGIPFALTTRDELDIADPTSVAAALARHRPWAVVNAAGYARIARAERDAQRCWRDNHAGAVALASACRCAGIRLVTFSTDHVFAGDSDRPYTERDAPRPLGVYGRSKAAADAAIRSVAPDALIVRTAALFSTSEPRNPAHRVVAGLADGRPVAVHRDVTFSPTYVPDLVEALLDLLIDGESGLWHIANDGATTSADFAGAAARLAGLDADLITHVDPPPFVPRYSALTSERAVLLRPWEEALDAWWRDLRRGPAHPLPAMRCAG